MMPKEQRRAAVVAFVGAVSVFFAFLVFGGGRSPALVVGRKRASVMPSWTLAGGVEFPLVAANTASLSAEEAEAMVRASLALGITNIDVHLGGSEREGVAAAVADLGRDAFFLVTKLDKPPADMTDPAAAAALARETVASEWAAMGVDSVDVLMLKDSATCEVMRAQWAVLEELLAAGKTRALGTYNFCEPALTCLLKTAKTPPALNYVMRHVGMGRDATGLIGFGEARGIRTVAYGTLGEPVALRELLDSRELQAIANAHRRPVEAVALKWNLQSGFAVSNRPTADYAPDNAPYGQRCTDACKASLTAMRDAFDWDLSRAEMAQLDRLAFDAYPQSPTYYSSAGCPNSFGVSDHPTKSSCGKTKAAWC